MFEICHNCPVLRTTCSREMFVEILHLCTIIYLHIAQISFFQSVSEDHVYQEIMKNIEAEENE